MLSDFVPLYIKNFSKKKISGFPGICYQCNFCTDGYSNSNVKHLLGENLHESVVRAVTRRKSEFVAGRYLAKKALIALGANKITVGVGTNRVPLWPDSFIGSISHSNEFAICAVANRDYISRVGIDVENCIDVKVAQDIVGSVLIESEYKFVGSYTNPNPTVLTLIFSAKESLFKALYPEVGRYFDFDAAQIKRIDFHTGQFTIELVQNLGPTLPLGSCFEGAFELKNKQVLTMIISLK
jgi:enterobactin synthetase component D